MQHIVFNTSSGQARVEIQNNVSKLLFSCDFYADVNQLNPVAPGYLGTTLPKISTWRDFCNGKINVTRYSKSGTKQLITSMRLSDLAEICANNEGMIFIKTLKTLAGQAYLRAEFSVELSNVGAIHSDKQDFLVVELNEFTTYNSGPGNVGLSGTITMSSLGSYVATQEVIKYEPLSLNAGAVSTFDVQGAYAIAVSDTFTRAFLTSVSGEILQIEANELETLACDIQDIVYNVDGLFLPMYKWKVLPIQLASKIQLEANANCVFYMMTNRDYGTDKVIEHNHRHHH